MYVTNMVTSSTNRPRSYSPNPKIQTLGRSPTAPTFSYKITVSR